MARDINLRITFGEEIHDERDAATIFAEMGMNCEGAESVTCIVGRARVTQADLDDEFWDHRCTRSDVHMNSTDTDE